MIGFSDTWNLEWDTNTSMGNCFVILAVFQDLQWDLVCCIIKHMEWLNSSEDD